MKQLLTRILFAMSVFVMVTSCSDDDTPEKVLMQPVPAASNITKTSFEVAWNSVDNATAYIYTVNNGAEQTTRDLSVSVTDLSPNTAYTFKVKAVDENGEWKESPIASLTVTTEDGPLTQFEIAASDITAYTARISVVPAETDKYYWYTLITEEDKNNTETSVSDLMQADLTWFINKYTNPDKNPDTAPDFNLTMEQMLATYGGKGTLTAICPVRKKKSLKPSTKYYVALAYVDAASGNLISEPEALEESSFTTLGQSLPWLEAKLSLGMSSTGTKTSSWVKIEWLAFGGTSGKFLVATKLETEAMLAKGYTYESLVEEFGNALSKNTFDVFDMLGFPMNSNYDDCDERTEYVGMLMVGNDQGKVYWHGEITTDPIADADRLFPATISDITDNNAKANFTVKNPTDFYWPAIVSEEDIINGTVPYTAIINQRNAYINRYPDMTLNEMFQKYALHGNQTLDLASRFGNLKAGTKYRLAVVKINPESGKLMSDIELYDFKTTGTSAAPRKKNNRIGLRPSGISQTVR